MISCSSSRKNLREYDGSYLDSAKLNYQAGQEALRNKDHPKALAYFQFVKGKYPFSQYAALSELGLADTKFAQKKWLESASLYEVFISLHPRHQEVEKAYYKVGASYFNAMPSDFFLLPPSSYKDQSFTKEALACLETFIQNFPQSSYVKDAVNKRDRLLEKLAHHIKHIADYYAKRGRYQAAIDRYLELASLYPSSPVLAESLFSVADLFVKLNDLDQAKVYYKKVIEIDANGYYGKRAKSIIDSDSIK